MKAFNAIKSYWKRVVLSVALATTITITGLPLHNEVIVNAAPSFVSLGTQADTKEQCQ